MRMNSGEAPGHFKQFADDFFQERAILEQCRVFLGEFILGPDISAEFQPGKPDSRMLVHVAAVRYADGDIGQLLDTLQNGQFLVAETEGSILFTTVTAMIRKKLIDPYMALLREQKYEEAWNMIRTELGNAEDFWQ